MLIIRVEGETAKEYRSMSIHSVNLLYRIGGGDHGVLLQCSPLGRRIYRTRSACCLNRGFSSNT